MTGVRNTALILIDPSGCTYYSGILASTHLPIDARIQQPRGPRGAGRWQQDGLVHHDAGQDRVSLGAPGPNLHLDRVRRP